MAEQDGRLVGVHGERIGAGGVFLADTEEALDGGTAVAAVDPVVVGTELKPCQRGVGDESSSRRWQPVPAWTSWPRRVKAFFSYVQRRVFPGGCFFAATSLEMGTRPGPVKDRLAAIQSEFTALLRSFAVTALEQHELPTDENPDWLAFELHAIRIPSEPPHPEGRPATC